MHKTHKNALYGRLTLLEAELSAIKKHIGELPDEGRPVTEGWEFWRGGNDAMLKRTVVDFGSTRNVVRIDRYGLQPIKIAGRALDGIAHDDKGRIKVVGYVNAEELKERVNRFDLHAKEAVCLIIDKLAG